MNHMIHPIETPSRLLAGRGDAFSRFKDFYWTQVQSPTSEWHTIGNLASWWYNYDFTLFPLIVQLRSAAGFDSLEVQLRWTKSPGLYSGFPPMITGGFLGKTSTKRSPNLLSVLNWGASVLTSHLYLPVLAKVRFTSVKQVELLNS